MKNELTTPLSGTPYYVNTGIIKAIDLNGYRFSVGEISYERFDDQNFQYIISPFWDLITYLPVEIFQGIPGINLTLKKEHYYRVNMTPAFIRIRTPSPSREDLWDLLEEVHLDYYDRFEWLLRSEKRCGDDNLIVVRKRPPRSFDNTSDLNDIQPGDQLNLNKMYDVSSKNSELTYSIYRALMSGAKIYIRSELRFLTQTERESMLYLLREMLEYNDHYSVIRQKEGIRLAKAKGKYHGRKRIPVDPLLLKRTEYEFRQGQLSEKDAMNVLNIHSRSTFYRRLKEVAPV